MVTIGEAFAPVEGIVYSAEDVKVKIGSNLIGPAGELHLTESSLIWTCEERNSSISIPWPRVGVQAISSNPEKCIYLMLDINLIWPGFYDGRPQNNGNENGDAGGEEEEDEHDEGHESDGSENEMTEMWLQPPTPQIVDEIYNAMRECQSLNPDPGAISEDEDYMEAEEDELQEVDDMRNLQLDDEDKFADAEE
ncbi:methylosome subunit pICln isoform X1 [Malaya genurostris]|uniref:methylosome subunit pICln isoform X1 n=1 Tax=Malaya genurostris TaxID=325434 RepID=UPI0026F39AB6|nr:methylosome subunit pICln isoform X1 [Malaya genurostris]XP_058465987.1 methylosome subunit pICln isoform X1 [Malaya genurostris]